MTIEKPDDVKERERAASDLPTARDIRSDRRLDVLIATVLAIAGLASAWASFQGGIWDKQEAESYALSNSYLTESSQLLIRSGQEAAVSAGLFLQWLDAKTDRQDVRASVIANLMPWWFSEEFERWQVALPKNLEALKPNAPLPVFKGPSLSAAQTARAQSDAARREAETASRIGDRYDVANVVLATALFLAGISSVLRRPDGQMLVVVLAGVLTAGSVVALMFTEIKLPG